MSDQKITNRVTLALVLLLLCFQLSTGLRSDLFAEESFFQTLSSFLGNSLFTHLLYSSLAVVLIIWIVRTKAAADNTRYFILALVTISLLIHFRSSVFFFWDEWDFISRMNYLGPKGVLYTHNEHFIPLFFSFYYGESLVFGTNYLLFTLVSVLFHSLNAFLIARLLRRVLAPLDSAPVIANTLAIFYTISALHSETLHWAFEQSVILSQLCITAALIYSWDYLERHEGRKLRRAMFFSFLAPLFFANGFTVILQIGLLALFYIFSHRVLNSERKAPKPEAPSSFRLSIRLLFCCGFALFFTLVLYYFNRNIGAGHSVDPTQMFANPKEAFKYLIVGSQLGTVLRGLALYPGIEFGTVRELFEIDGQAQLISLKRLLFHDPDGIVFLGGLGVSVVLLLLIPLTASKNRMFSFGLWLFGQAFICSFFILPALGRWHLGLGQALSLRYQYGALIGLALLSAPLIGYLFEQEGKRRLPHIIATLFFANLLFTQLWSASHFDYFTSRGQRNLLHAAALKNGDPAPPDSFPPHVGNSQIRAVLEFLRKE